MTTDNPFEVSELCTGSRQTDSPFANPAMFRVEGDLLVCGDSVILPQVCARSLTCEDLVAKSTPVQFASFRLVLVQRHCAVTYYVTRSKTRRWSMMLVSLVSAIAAAILLTATLGGLSSIFPAIIFTVWFVMMLVQFIRRRNSVPLTLVSYQAPGIYRIRGFSRAYLDTISRWTGGRNEQSSRPV